VRGWFPQHRSHQFRIGVFRHGCHLTVAKGKYPTIGIVVSAAVSGRVLTLSLHRDHIAFRDHVKRMALTRGRQNPPQRREQIAHYLRLAAIILRPTGAADDGPLCILRQCIHKGLPISARGFPKDVFQAFSRCVEIGAHGLVFPVARYVAPLRPHRFPLIGDPMRLAMLDDPTA